MLKASDDRASGRRESQGYDQRSGNYPFASRSAGLSRRDCFVMRAPVGFAFLHSSVPLSGSGRTLRKLIDSIWRGYPIGTSSPVAEERTCWSSALGRPDFRGQRAGQAWFVVDGQQRIVSLVSTLIPKGDRAAKFDMYFDLVLGEITHAHRGPLPSDSPSRLTVSLIPKSLHGSTRIASTEA